MKVLVRNVVAVAALTGLNMPNSGLAAEPVVSGMKASSSQEKAMIDKLLLKLPSAVSSIQESKYLKAGSFLRPGLLPALQSLEQANIQLLAKLLILERQPKPSEEERKSIRIAIDQYALALKQADFISQGIQETLKAPKNADLSQVQMKLQEEAMQVLRDGMKEIDFSQKTAHGIKNLRKLADEIWKLRQSEEAHFLRKHADFLEGKETEAEKPLWQKFRIEKSQLVESWSRWEELSQALRLLRGLQEEPRRVIPLRGERKASGSVPEKAGKQKALGSSTATA